MRLLQMRDVPEHIYRLLEEQAVRERRSLSQQAIAVLARGLHVALDAKGRRQNLLRTIQETGGANPHRLSDPAKLIRKDRER